MSHRCGNNTSNIYNGSRHLDTEQKLLRQSQLHTVIPYAAANIRLSSLLWRQPWWTAPPQSPKCLRC
eukprot:3426447-Prorocentrum_lima.AAC.1